MVDHSKHPHVSEANVLFFEWCECIIAYRVQDQLFSGLFSAQVVVVALLEDLVLRHKLSLLGGHVANA